ncbi:hypothetical protein D3C81_1139010 [compost metagenome]
MALLVPRVGEVDAHFIERTVGDFLLQHFHCIVVKELDVFGVVIGQCIEQATDARCMHFDADVILRRIELHRITQRGAIAETNLQHLGRSATEGGVEVARLAGEVQAETRPAFVERTLLGRREAALAQHETADFTAPFLDGERLGRCLGAGAFKRIGHQPINPSTGEDALA